VKFEIDPQAAERIFAAARTGIEMAAGQSSNREEEHWFYGHAHHGHTNLVSGNRAAQGVGSARVPAPGTGKFTINRRTVEQYFPNHAWKHDAVEPLKFTNIADQVDVVVTAHGGGVGGQAGAVRMGLSRAISRFNPELRPALRKNGFLTRDSRMKERKKYGQKGARKRFQFTKR